MALILADRVKETSTTSGNGVFTLAGAASGFQSFAVIGNTNTTFYCIAGQGTSEWEVGIGTYATSGTTLTRTTVLSNSSATQPSALSFAAGTKDVFVTYPSEKSVNLDASGNATALGTPVAFTGTNITGTATAFTASNVTTNANLTGMVTSVGNAASLGSFTSAQLSAALTDETGTGVNVFATSPTLVTPLLGTPTSGVLTNCTGLPVAGGGTGVATTTAYGILAGGTTATGAFQNIGTGTSAQVLTSNGAGALPTFQAASGVTTVGFGTTGLTPSGATSGAVTVAGTLAVANGGTGVTTSTGSGDNVLGTSPTLVTPALGTPASGVLTNCTGTSTALNAGIGVGQTWQNVLASRAAATTYTNSTGKPIFVLITCTSGGTTIIGTINALTFNTGIAAGAYYNCSTLYLVVPNGSTYRTNSFGAGSQSWHELR